MSATAPKKVTERDMLDRLNRRYATYNGNGIRFTRAEHVKIATGFDAQRICDYMALDLWTGYGPDRGPKLHGHEVKVSRADWLSELKRPEKAQAFTVYCDYWWLVVSDRSIVKPDELPAGWGLMAPHGQGLRVFVQAERLDVLPMPRSLQATFSRAVTKTTLRLAEEDAAMRFLADRMRLPAADAHEQARARLLEQRLQQA